MDSREQRAKLLARTRSAVRVVASVEAAIERRGDGPPRPGDLYVFRQTEDVEWAVIGRSGDGRYLEVVPADPSPQAGSADVEVPRTAPGGPLTLRCRFANWLEVRDFDRGRRAGFVDEATVDRARRKRAEIDAGSAAASILEEEADEDPESEDRDRELLSAQQVLAEAMLEEKVLAGVIDGDLGFPVPSLDFERVPEIAQAERPDFADLALLRNAHLAFTQATLGLAGGVDPTDLPRTGWGLVLHAEESPAVRKALSPLVEHRRAQLGEDGSAAVPRILEYRDGDGVRGWLARHGVAAGDPNPAKVPYYLLLAGSPERLPFRFQTLLAVEYAVGRLSFETPEEYRRYADSVIAQETGAEAPPDRAAVFFCPRHRREASTFQRADLLVRPLMDGDGESPGVAEAAGFETERLWSEDATKARLRQVLHRGSDALPPALLFAACPGLGWSAGHAEQVRSQGALVCQDGLAGGQLGSKGCLRAADVDDGANVRGMIAVFHAAYSVGTPRRDEALEGSGDTPELAPRPFVAALPRRLLAHPQGSALAVIGQIGRSWSLAAPGTGEGSRTAPFEEVVRELLHGSPAGYAIQTFHQRHAKGAAELAEIREKAAFGRRTSGDEVARAWVERNEGQSYVLLGDPAVRLRTGSSA